MGEGGVKQTPAALPFDGTLEALGQHGHSSSRYSSPAD
jgi:hypothetical protein